MKEGLQAFLKKLLILDIETPDKTGLLGRPCSIALRSMDLSVAAPGELKSNSSQCKKWYYEI